MKKITIWLLLVSLSVLNFSCKKVEKNLEPENFQNPPHNVKIHTWWHWLDGNITKEGITKDLEAMKAQGIAQATILNIGLLGNRDFGVKKTQFNTPEWFEMFQWALKEANRLGITIGAHNCDGWSTSGGPWITPEMSMKQFIWTKTVVNSENKAPIKLLRPMTKNDFYKDVAVIAVKTSASPSKIFPASILVNDTLQENYLHDGCPVSAYSLSIGNTLTFKYDAPFTAEKVSILPRRPFMWNDPAKYISEYELSFSNDGKNFKPFQKFSIKGLNNLKTIDFPSISAKYFRLKLTNNNYLDPWIPFLIAECEFLPKGAQTVYSPSVVDFSDKTGDIKAVKDSIFYTQSTTSKGTFESIDVTSKMSADGTLNWTPTDGNWSIIRFGYTTTGATNGPATKAGTGLECDKMDTAALNLHFRNFPAKLIENAGNYAGNTFKFMLIDSWECGFQNWTASLPAQFEKLRGYSLIPFIPVLCGERSGDATQDNAILFDFRKTVADLIENNYYKHFSELLHEKKIEFHAEVIYGNANYPPLDILKTTKYVDLPMYEFWSTTNDNLNLTYYPVKGVELNMPSCAAIGYEKPVMASEAYTGMAHYCETPGGLKPFGDRAFCAGVNQMILHSYVHQPTDNKPGMTLGQFGSHFNRNNSYFPFISDWFTFQSRIQYVLQQGVAHHDVLYYLGDQLPQFLEYNVSNTLPFGYMFNSCNFDILKNRIDVEDGKLVLNGKTSYSLLSFPAFSQMSFETLKRLEELVNKGAVVYAPKPEKMFSLNDLKNNKKQFEELTAKLWGNIDGKSVTENAYGKGKVYWGVPISKVLEKQKILPDLYTQFEDTINILFIHKKVGNSDVYFVANQQNKELKREVSFRVSDKTPQIWNAEYGTISNPAIFSTNEKYTTLPVTFKPYQSLIFVFENKKPKNFINKVTQNGNQIFPSAEKNTLAAIPKIELRNNEFVNISSLSGEYELTTNKNKTVKLNQAQKQEFIINDFTAQISFESSYPNSIKPLLANKLEFLSEMNDPQIKYFSGTANYNINFKFDTTELSKSDSVMLDLGAFESIAEVKLNGQNVGIFWQKGSLKSINGFLKENNILEISVANTYRNRFIGDFTEYGKVQNLWTSSKISDFLNKNRPLEPSGLKGPLKIMLYNTKKIDI